MVEVSSPVIFSGFPDDLEKITIPLNDLEDTPEGDRRRRRGSGTKGVSPGRMKRSESRDQRLRSIKSLENEKPTQKKSISPGSFFTKVSTFSPKSPSIKRSGSANSIRERLRQRLQGVNYCDLNDSDNSECESLTKVRSNEALLLSDDEDCTVDESEEFLDTQKKIARNRSKSRQRSRSKSSKRISKKEHDSERDDSLKKPRSKSKNRIRSKSNQKRRSSKAESTKIEDETSILTVKSKQKRRSSKVGITEVKDETSISTSKSKQKRRSSKVEIAETEDESSIANSTNNSTCFSRRSGRRRPKSLVGDEAKIVSDDYTDVDGPFDPQTPVSSKSFGSASRSSLHRKSRRPSGSRNSMDISNSSVESPIISPGSKKAKKRTKIKKTNADEEQSLGSLFESERSKKRPVSNDDLSQVTEERSNDDSAESQPVLLQFDPTSGNHVRSVNQDKAKKTSEFIQGLHGTTSNLEISKLAGLPTFEKLNTSDSTSSTGESLDNFSHRNHIPLCLSTIHTSPKKQGTIRSSSMVSPTSRSLQTPGEAPYEGGTHNAQWNFSGTNSARQSRSVGIVGKSMLKKLDKPARRSSDIGARTNSLGAIMGLRGRYKSRNFEDIGYGDGESLLKC
jgi:hypothetical protein